MSSGLIGVLVAVADVVLAMAVTIHAVLRKRDSRAAIGWVGLAWLAPFLGSFTYLLLGINRIERRARGRIERRARELGLRPGGRERPAIEGEREGEALALRALPAGRESLAGAGRRVTGLPLLGGNRVAPLENGDEAYPAMIAAIDGARSSVSLLSYIFEHDATGQRFVEALAQAVARGVAVRVLIDAVGARYGRSSIVKALRRRGVPVATFLPTRIPRLPRTANLRNHRKIMVVDGALGFTGGTNIRSDHVLADEPRLPTRCLHFRVEGPVVAHLQDVFAVDWAFTTGETLAGAAWFPPLAHAGETLARGVEDGPDESFERLVYLISCAIAAARQRIRIVTPYFLPSASLISALNVASLSGVAVEVLIPATNNVALAQWACTAQLWQILEKGCRVYRTPEPFDHSKLLVVDDDWCLIGSTNWDPRSLRLNFELNVECYCPALVASLHAIVDAKLEGAEEVTLEALAARSFGVRLRDGLARLLTPYL